MSSILTKKLLVPLLFEMQTSYDMAYDVDYLDLPREKLADDG